MNLAYWPDTTPAPRALPQAGDWIHPETKEQAPLTKYMEMTVLERVALDIYELVRDPSDPNQRYSEAWERDRNLGTARLVLTPVGYAPIDGLKEKRLSEVADKRRAVARAGTSVNLPPPSSRTVNISTDTETVDIINTIGNAQFKGVLWPQNGIPMQTLEGNRFRMSEVDYTAIVKEIAKHLIQTATVADNHADAIIALADPQAVIDYDISTGWPANP